MAQSENEKLEKLLDYLERYWFGQVGPSKSQSFRLKNVLQRILRVSIQI